MGSLFTECDAEATIGVEPTRVMAAKDRNLHHKRTISAQEKSSGTKITSISLRAILERQEYRCSLTGETLNPEGCSLDHKTPLSRGGRHVNENVQFITNDANRLKGEMTNEEFIAMCQSVVTHIKGGGGLLGPSK